MVMVFKSTEQYPLTFHLLSKHGSSHLVSSNPLSDPSCVSLHPTLTNLLLDL